VDELCTQLATPMIRKVVLICFLALPLETNTFSQPSIGPADGDYLTVESTEIVYLPDAVRCGFNDASAPNMGRFRREHLRIESTSVRSREV
jgi:hypothetical protein